jgi:hypothetical protein
MKIKENLSKVVSFYFNNMVLFSGALLTLFFLSVMPDMNHHSFLSQVMKDVKFIENKNGEKVQFYKFC